MRESSATGSGAEPADSAERRASTASTVCISDSSSRNTEERTSSSKRGSTKNSRRTRRSSGDSGSGDSGRAKSRSREAHVQKAKENHEGHDQRGESSRSRRTNREGRDSYRKAQGNSSSSSSNSRSHRNACGSSQSSNGIGLRRHSSSSGRSDSSTGTEECSGSSASMGSQDEILSNTQKSVAGSSGSRGYARRRSSATVSEQEAASEVPGAAKSAAEVEAGLQTETHAALPTKRWRTGRRTLPLSLEEEEEEGWTEKGHPNSSVAAISSATAAAAEDVFSENIAAGFGTRRDVRATKTSTAAGDGIATERFLTSPAEAASLNTARLLEDVEKEEENSSSDVEVVAVAVPLSRWTAYLRQQQEAKKKSSSGRLRDMPAAGSLEEPETGKTATAAEAATADVDAAAAGNAIADVVADAGEPAADAVVAAGDAAGAGDTEEAKVLATAAAEGGKKRQTRSGECSPLSEVGEAAIAQGVERAAAGRPAAEGAYMSLVFPETIHLLPKHECKDDVSIAQDGGSEAAVPASTGERAREVPHASNSRDSSTREREENCSERVLQALLLLASRYEQQGEVRRAHGFRVAAAAVRRLCFGTSSSSSNTGSKRVSAAAATSSSSSGKRREAQKTFETAETVLHAEGLTKENYKLLRRQPGIGEKIFQTIEEVVLTGSSSRMHALSSSSRAHALEQLQRVWGVGFYTAERLLARAINSVAGLRDTLRRLEETGRHGEAGRLLSRPQRLGLMYVEAFEQHIPRAEVAAVAVYLRQLLLPEEQQQDASRQQLSPDVAAAAAVQEQQQEQEQQQLLIDAQGELQQLPPGVVQQQRRRFFSAPLFKRHCPFTALFACGSYRRGKADCGDIDILLIRRNLSSRKLLTQVIKGLTAAGLLVEHLLMNSDTCAVEEEDEGDAARPSRMHASSKRHREDSSGSTAAAETADDEIATRASARKRAGVELYCGVCVWPPRVPFFGDGTSAEIAISGEGGKEKTSQLPRPEAGEKTNSSSYSPFVGPLLPRRIDIKIYPARCSAFALLYFTGSAEYNRAMRLWAKRCGYSLDDTGLYPIASFPVRTNDASPSGTSPASETVATATPSATVLPSAATIPSASAVSSANSAVPSATAVPSAVVRPLSAGSSLHDGSVSTASSQFRTEQNNRAADGDFAHSKSEVRPSLPLDETVHRRLGSFEKKKLNKSGSVAPVVWKDMRNGVKCDTEQDIFHALGLEYVPPAERDVFLEPREPHFPAFSPIGQTKQAPH